jgi:hypothetical protein
VQQDMWLHAIRCMLATAVLVSSVISKVVQANNKSI